MLDEIQKIPSWSQSVKRLWDEDTHGVQPQASDLQHGVDDSAIELWREYRGYLIESAVGAHLVKAAAAGECEVFYWRERNVEVDFMVRCGHALTALEVKSGRASAARAGLRVFSEAFKLQRKLLVGPTE